jgi:hypothetical protein
MAETETFVKERMHRETGKVERVGIGDSNRMIRFARRNAFPEYVPKGQVFHGWAIAVVEEPARGLQEITLGIAEQVQKGTSEDSYRPH